MAFGPLVVKIMTMKYNLLLISMLSAAALGRLAEQGTKCIE